MKKVLRNILYYLVVITITALVFEYLFTYSHYNKAPRNPVSWVMSLDSSDTFDYIVLGSSRALHHVDPLQIEELTGKHGLNLGLQDGKPFDSKLFVKRLVNEKVTEAIYIQIDDSWNFNKAGEKSSLNWLPFIDEDLVWQEFEKLDERKYYYYKHLPFYKFASYESEIGIRDYIKGLLGQELSAIKDKGYIPLGEAIKDKDTEKQFKIDLRDSSNVHFEEILALCKKNNVEVFFFTTPIYNAEGNHSILKKYLPNYHDYTNLIDDPKYFKDARHLNAAGVKFFMKELVGIIH